MWQWYENLNRTLNNSWTENAQLNLNTMSFSVIPLIVMTHELLNVLSGCKVDKIVIYLLWVTEATQAYFTFVALFYLYISVITHHPPASLQL